MRRTIWSSVAPISVTGMASGVDTASGAPPTVASSTVTATSSVGLALASSVWPALRNSSLPMISNRAASAPVRPSTFTPRPSSITTMSATLVASVVSSGIPLTTGVRVTPVGAWFTGCRRRRR
jgi:hypothetical protein